MASSFHEHRATELAQRDKPLWEELLEPITSCTKYQEPTLDLPGSTNPRSQDSEQVLESQSTAISEEVFI